MNHKRKGTRFENEVIKLAKSFGLTAYRHAGSGAFEGLKHDGTVYLAGFGKASIECKKRKEGAGRTLESWRDGADVLITCADRGQPWAHIPLEMLFQLCKTIQDYEEEA